MLNGCRKLTSCSSELKQPNKQTWFHHPRPLMKEQCHECFVMLVFYGCFTSSCSKQGGIVRNPLGSHLLGPLKDIGDLYKSHMLWFYGTYSLKKFSRNEVWFKTSGPPTTMGFPYLRKQANESISSPYRSQR